MAWGKKGKPRTESALDGREEEFRAVHDSWHDEVIAEMFDVSVVTIGKWRRRLGLKKTKQFRKRSTIYGREEEFRQLQDHRTDAELGRHFGVSASTIEKWRKRLGLTKDQRGRWTRTDHPRGFAGKTHDDATRAELGHISRAMWDGFSEERRAEIVAQRLKTRSQNGTLIPPRHKVSWRQGWETVGGKRCYFRSKWEVNYACYLEWLKQLGEISEWEYEPKTFWFEQIRRGARSYTPDFRLTNASGSIEYHEVKGWMDQRSKTKLKRMAKYHPGVKLVLVDAETYRKMHKQLNGLVPGWE